MKKFIAALATMLFAMSFLFGATGCNDNKAQQPSEEGNAASTQQPQSTPDTDIDSDPEPAPDVPSGSSRAPWPKYVSFTDFEKFKNYYETEFAALNSEKFYLLYPAMESVNGGFPSYFAIQGDATIYDDEPYINPVITESFTVYSEELGTGFDTNMDTGTPPCTFDLNINLYPLPEDHIKDNKFVFEFSEYSGEFKWHYVIRIFEKDVLIGEFYYAQSLEISREWIENYITENLI